MSNVLNRVRGFAVASVLLFATSQSVAFQQRQEPYNPPPFTAYPQTAAFRYAIYTHVDPTRASHQESPLFFNATWFVSDSEVAAERLQIYKDGYVYSARSVYDWAEQASHWAQLTSSEQGRISELVETIEQVDGKPQLADLLIVSFSRNGKWTTVLLDRNKLPESISKIYLLTKARSPVRGSVTQRATP